MEALHGASSEVTRNANHTCRIYPSQPRHIFNVHATQSDQSLWQLSEPLNFGDGLAGPETVSQLNWTAAWTGCKTCMFLQQRLLCMEIWQSCGCSKNQRHEMIGCSVIVLQSRRSPNFELYILDKALRCPCYIEATTPGNRIRTQPRRFAACGNNKGFSCAIAGPSFDHWLLDTSYHFMPYGKTEDCKGL